MTSVPKIVATLEAWSSPKEAFHRGQRCPFLLSCSLDASPATFAEIAELDVGRDLQDFWRISMGADLFKDEKYGQWGLKILSPSEVIVASDTERRESPGDLNESDFVIGEFYGDSDLLIIDSHRAEQGEYPVLVKLPIDARNEWPLVAESFSDFLERYVASQGDKYWEQS